jgi:7-carboxy-7-deazaguanine synthase
MKAQITEIFVSIQGEGLYAGQKQVFVRFAGCDLGCEYCDEPAAKGGGKEVPVAVVKKEIWKLALKEKAKAVSFTGGEPLLQAGALLELARYARKLGLETHLETNGTRWKELKKVVGAFDVVAADIKLPGTSGKAFWAEHKEFLALAGKKAFVKVVVTSKTSLPEFKKAVLVAAAASPAITFFIQPVTPKGGLKPPSWKQLEILYRLAAAKLESVRILPQLHKLWGIK